MPKFAVVPAVSGRLPRSPERQELADKIEAYQEAVRELEGVQKAIETAEYAAGAARRELEGAEAAIEKAKGDAVEYLKGRALGTAGEAPLSVKDARVAARDAEDILEMARAGRDGLLATVPRHESSVAIRRSWMDEALKAALASDPMVAKISARCAELDGELTRLRVILTRVAEPEAQMGRPVSMSPETFEALLAPWKTAIEALRSEPDAPLPSI